MGDAAALLREYDARARAIVVREVRRVRAMRKVSSPLGTPWTPCDWLRFRQWTEEEIRIIRGSSRERLRIRATLRAIEGTVSDLKEWRTDLDSIPDYWTIEAGEVTSRIGWILRNGGDHG